ncbi:hypothetical protein [Streptomyces sp. NPDC058664]|uniref:hypothetical protein n=1 Tax=unclassified Streptomyces TaxID=2593676 RepID=UPI0036681E4D
MIYRHFNAPSRAFSQFSHELIRHPRLSSDAVRLLTWQLSLPRSASESLSRTAERARIGSCAFARAKRQLKDEGFVHERRVQGAGGRWITQQLVSSTPLTTDQAAKLLAGGPATPQAVPSPRKPAAGQPTTPPTGRHPKKHPKGDTSNLPAETDEAGQAVDLNGQAGSADATGSIDTNEPADLTPTSPHLEEARALVGTLHLLSPALRHIPPGMRDELTRLATRWLDAGHTPADIHEHVQRGLPGAGTPVHRPGGLLRYLLRDVPPLTLPTAAPATTPDQLSPRLRGTRECASSTHTQPMLFRPHTDETLCPECAVSVPGREFVRVPS